jgi:hypothetical protein
LKEKIPFVEIPEKYKNLIGEPDKGTRMFRAYGNEDDFSKWYDIVTEICQGDGSVGIGTAAAYSKVSRPAVHKRMKEGRLTAFCFHLVEDSKFFKDWKKLAEGGFPYVYIPVSECKAWAESLKNRKDRQEALKEADEGSWNDRFLKSNLFWRKKLNKGE